MMIGERMFDDVSMVTNKIQARGRFNFLTSY